MEMYIFLLVLFIAFLIISRDRSAGKRTTLFSFTILIIFAGLKYRVGSDALLYQDLYEQYPKLFELDYNYISSSRWGALFICWFSLWHTLFDSFIFYQFLHAVILIYAVYLTIKRYTSLMMPAVVMFYVILYVYMVFDLYREGLAASLFLYALPLLEKKKYLAYYILCLFCFNIHTSSFVCFLVPLLYKFQLYKYTWKPLAVCFILAFIIPIFFIQLCTYIPIDSIRILALTYLAKNIDVDIMTISRAFFCITIYYFAIHKNLNRINDKNRLLVNIAYLSLLIECLDKSVPFIFRLNSYFKIFLIITVSIYIENELKQLWKCNDIKKILPVVFSMVVLCGPKLLDYFKSEGTHNAYFPYVSVFDPQRIYKREFHSVNEYLYYDRKN